MSHIFLPVYLDADKKVLDTSVNAVETLDASFNFLMNTTYCTATNISNFLKYKRNNNNYTFKFNESYKILFENNMKDDISGSSIELYNNDFYSGIDPNKACIGRIHFACNLQFSMVLLIESSPGAANYPNMKA